MAKIVNIFMVNLVEKFKYFIIFQFKDSAGTLKRIIFEMVKNSEKW